MSSYEPGSRAITIPLHAGSLRTATSRQTRSKFLARTDISEAGPSSLSSHGSSWSSPQSSAHSPRDQPLRKPVHRPSLSPPARHLLDRASGQETASQRKDKQAERRHPHTPHTPSTSPPSELPAAAAGTVHGAVHNSPLGPSMIASSSYKSINLSSRSDPDEPPRLITYTKHSQGFTWNDELFLPGYLLGRYGGGASGRRRRYRWGMDGDEEDEDHDDDDDTWGVMGSNGPERCPVTEIFVTDEEADAMMP